MSLLVPKWVGRAFAEPTTGQPTITRKGYEFNVPRDDWNKDGNGAQMQQQERREVLNELFDLYKMCSWVSTPVNTIARRITAGGVEIIPAKQTGGQIGEPPRPPQLDRLEALLQRINPTEDPMQFFRRCFQELLIFGDSYIEVGWLMEEPVMLWGLDPITMVEDCDEHGVVTGYRQIMDDTSRDPVEFEPRQVIHLSLDSPRGGQYGLSPTELALVPGTAWLWNKACIKETARRGFPPRIHANFAPGTTVKTVDDWVRRTFTRVIGAKNIGQPFTTINAQLGELQTSRVVDLLEVDRNLRDELVAIFGTSPATVNIIESGNLGGGTGESQERNLRINTAVPLETILLEKLNWHITRQGFGITDWKVHFGEVDYRDSKVIEDINYQRLKGGAFTVNRWRSSIGEPDIPGGDDAIFETPRQGPILWSDMVRFNEATMEGLEAKAQPPATPSPDQSQPATSPAPAPTARGATSGAAGRDQLVQESAASEEMRSLEHAFSRAYRHRRKEALRESAKVT